MCVCVCVYYKWMCPGLQKCDLSCSCESVCLFIGTSTLIDLFMQQSGSRVLFMFTNIDGHSDIWRYCLRVMKCFLFFLLLISNSGSQTASIHHKGYLRAGMCKSGVVGCQNDYEIIQRDVLYQENLPTHSPTPYLPTYSLTPWSRVLEKPKFFFS